MWVSVLENNRTVFVAETGGKVIGFANASNNNDTNSPYPGEIFTLYVLKSAHKVGIGKQLFEVIKEDLLNQSLFPFVTYVLADNPALGFYQHMGAEIIGEHLENFDGVAIKELQLLWK